MLRKLTLAGLALCAAYAFSWHYHFFDMKIYLGALSWWADGRDLYTYAAPESGLGFTYPPIAAIMLTPLAGWTAEAAGWFLLLGGVAALALVLPSLLRPLMVRYGWRRRYVVAAALPLALCTEPVRQTLGMGQVNLLLFALVVADLMALRRQTTAPQRGRMTRRGFSLLRRPTLTGWHRFWRGGEWAGIGIGIAAAVKLTPALFIVYLVLTRQWRAAGTAVVSGGAATVTGFVIAPDESLRYFGSVLWDTGRVGNADTTANQSLGGLLARLHDTVDPPLLPWLLCALTILAVGLTRAHRAHTAGDELVAFTLVGLTANLVSPISWTHHLLFLLPAVVILAEVAARRATTTGPDGAQAYPPRRAIQVFGPAISVYLITVITPIWFYAHELPRTSHYADGLWGVLFENALALLLIALVTTLPGKGEQAVRSPSVGVGDERPSRL
ncbi:glycosyltransferase 87 family protein [Actinoplanes sp. NEAU-A12]|uniref:Glycosyltransferase 87 family protein n=1 Tax=Actinoplanes sandaracinus TaxID=3045177 RepID=A0ABT6WMT3_9ACTN|nr:glycosyltransferase 87 family protein [Actinoplanes sandaracinus]MDI6101057.1 glycosyltransferase 87 family protein [Actinoplanes sandaracinus]